MGTLMGYYRILPFENGTHRKDLSWPPLKAYVLTAYTAGHKDRRKWVSVVIHKKTASSPKPKRILMPGLSGRGALQYEKKLDAYKRM